MLQELTTSAVTKVTRSITANFFIPDTILIIYKNKLFILKTIFVPKIKLKSDYSSNYDYFNNLISNYNRKRRIWFKLVKKLCYQNSLTYFYSAILLFIQ